METKFDEICEFWGFSTKMNKIFFEHKFKEGSWKKRKPIVSTDAKFL